MANFWGGCTPPRHSGTWVGARVASLRCHYPPPRRSQYSRNAEDRPHQSKTSCRGGHRRGTTTSGPGRGPLAGFEVTFYGRFSGDRRGIHCDRLPVSLSCNPLRKLLTVLHYLQVLNPVWGYPNPRNATPKRFQIISFNLIHFYSNIIIVFLSTKANSWTLEWPIARAGETWPPVSSIGLW